MCSMAETLLNSISCGFAVQQAVGLQQIHRQLFEFQRMLSANSRVQVC